MRLTALLSFYDEQPAQLERLVASLPVAGVTHLVALDGAYSLYPGGKAKSPLVQTKALRAACRTHGIKLTLEQPTSTWAGNEIEKRSRLFAAAETITTEHDWLLIMDADETVDKAPADLHVRLADSWFDVGELTYREANRTIPFPKLFRAIRGLHCHANHYTYRTPDGRHLWGNAHTFRLEPRLPVTDMYVTHRPTNRTTDRLEARAGYYKTRDQLGIEVHAPIRAPHAPPLAAA
jgi:hypothetical protein